MAMSNLNCNNRNETNSAQKLSNLSPIYEGEVFASPATTISPSLSQNTIDHNHVALFNAQINSHNMALSHGSFNPKNNTETVSPTTSTPSSNSSNTPTPTVYHSSNSLFNIPSTNHNPPCIPCVGLMHGNISKTSTSSSSPSPSLDTTVSPVTKMDLIRDLKIFEDIDTDEYSTQTQNQSVSIDYLTGDMHQIRDSKKTQTHVRNSVDTSNMPSPLSSANRPVINGSNVHFSNVSIYNSSQSHSAHKMNGIMPMTNGHSKAIEMNGNITKKRKSKKKVSKISVKLPMKGSKSHKSHRTHKHKHKSRRHSHSHQTHHSHSHSHKKHKRNKKSHVSSSSYSDSDTELQKKGKIKDKIKGISIRVPGDPNGLYKYWKRTKSKSIAKHKKKKEKSIVSPVLNIFNEHKAENIDMYNIDESFKLTVNPISLNNINNIRQRDRLNSYPPHSGIAYSIKSPHTLSPPSPSSSISMSNSYSNNSNSSVGSMGIPVIKTSKSCSNLLCMDTNKAIIIHTPTNTGNDCSHEFSVLGLQKYQKKRGKTKKLTEKKSTNVNGYGQYMSVNNRIRVNSYPPCDISDIVIERSDDCKDQAWHYTNKKSKKKHKKHSHSPYMPYYYGNNAYYDKYNNNGINETEIPTLPLESLSLGSLSDPNALSHIKIKSNKTKRKWKNMCDNDKRYNIHPSMAPKGNLYDL